MERSRVNSINEITLVSGEEGVLGEEFAEANDGHQGGPNLVRDVRREFLQAL